MNMTDTQNMLGALKEFFASKYAEIIKHQRLSEPKLLDKLKVMSDLNLQRDKISDSALFGKSFVISDYRSNNNKILIEFKKIGLKKKMVLLIIMNMILRMR